MSAGVFYPDRTGTPFTGGLLELDHKDASQIKPPCSTMPAKGACKCVSVSNQHCFKMDGLFQSTAMSLADLQLKDTPRRRGAIL